MRDNRSRRIISLRSKQPLEPPQYPDSHVVGQNGPLISIEECPLFYRFSCSVFLEIFRGGLFSLANLRHDRLLRDHLPGLASSGRNHFSSLSVGPGVLLLVGFAGASERRAYYEQD